MSMTSIERRWLSIVLPSFLDPAARGFTLEPGEVDFVAGATRMYEASSIQGRFGMRLAVLFAMLSPVFILGRPRVLSGLSRPDRAAVLASVCSHRLFIFRGLGILLKLAASMAMFRVASARARTNYERRDNVVSVPLRFALPVIATAHHEAA